MVAAAGAGVTAVEHELLGAQAAGARFLVQGGDVVDQLGPAGCRMDVDLDDAGIRRHAEHAQARVARRPVAFEAHRQPGGRGAGLDGRDQPEPVLDARERRQEDVQQPVADLHAEGGVHHVARRGRGSFVLGKPARRLGQFRRLRRAAGRCGCAGASAGGGTGRSRRPGQRRRIASGGLRSNGSFANSGSTSSGSRQGSDSSGRRRPSGESPSTRNRRPRRSGHLLERQRGLAAAAPAAGPARPRAAARSRPPRRHPAAAAARAWPRCCGSFRS